MNKLRLVAATASVAVALTLPAGAFAAAHASTPAQPSTQSQITPTAPSRLTTTTPNGAASATTSTQSGPLPNTGLDLLPETLAGVALLGAGVALRIRRVRG